MLNVCVNLGLLEWVREIYILVWKGGFFLDISVGNVFVSIYVKCGSFSDVLIVFEKMIK